MSALLSKVQLHSRHDDVSEITYNAGSAYLIEPGHNAWVNGDTAAVAYEFHGFMV